MAQLNDAVRHVLTLKYLAGMFSNPDQGSVQRYNTEELTPGNLGTALTTAEESLVLLNNNDHALPLSSSVGKVAVVGPLADDAVDQLGPDVPIGYSESAADTGPGGADQIVTVKQGMRTWLVRATSTSRRVHQLTVADRHRGQWVRRGGAAGAELGRDRDRRR